MIDEKTIQNIAKLARLSITEEEGLMYVEQLTKVLTHFQQIETLDTKNVAPLVTPIEIEFYARPDVPQQNNKTEDMLAGAPDRAGNLFKVPPVV